MNCYMTGQEKGKWGPFNTGDCLLELTAWGRFDCILNIGEIFI